MNFERTLITVLCLILFSNIITAQSLYSDNGYYNNSLHVTLTPNPFYGFVNINYERKIIQSEKNRIAAEAGFGAWVTWGAGGTTYKLKINDSFGKKSHHLETGLGVMALYDKQNYEIGVSNAGYFGEVIPKKTKYVDYFPAVSVGYLFKRPQGGFIFKIAIAWPESAYLGFGYGF